MTRRVRPLQLNGRVVHQIGLPYHWAGKGLVTGDPANELIGFVADPNVSIQESKVFTVMIEPGRRSQKRRIVTSGSIVTDLDPQFARRDLPVARSRPEAAHGFKAEESKESNP